MSKYKKLFRFIYFLTIIFLFLFSLFISFYEKKSILIQIIFIVSFLLLIIIENKKIKSNFILINVFKLLLQSILIFYFTLSFIFSITNYHIFYHSLRNIIIEFLPITFVLSVLIFYWIGVYRDFTPRRSGQE
jgi:hypothetical protein